MVTSDVLGGAFVLLVTLGVVIGLPLLVTDWIRQRHAAREQKAYLEAWTRAQGDAQRVHSAGQEHWQKLHERGVDLQQEGLAQSQAINERYLQVHARRIELAEELLIESRRTNELLARLVGKLGGGG